MNHHRRPRAEDCERLAMRDVRAQIQAGDSGVMLADGTSLSLRWRIGPRCYGGGFGQVPAFVCSCGASCVVLRRPPGGSWSCWRCLPMSFPSHRRSGGRGGRKPASWHTARWAESSARVADLLGLAQWPPQKLFWAPEDLLEAPRKPDAPRLSERRQRALVERLDALDAVRLIAALQGSNQVPQAHDANPLNAAQIEDFAAAAEARLAATAWAARETASDPRTASGRRRRQLSPMVGR